MPTLNILPAKAIYLYQLQPDTNKFGVPIALAWFDVQKAEARPIFHFDLGAIPARYATLRATLELDYQQVSLQNEPCDAYRVSLGAWSRTQATWNSYLTGFPWNTPGGDYNPLDPGSVDFVTPAELGVRQHDVTLLAEDAIQKRARQLHFLIRRRVRATPDTLHIFGQGGAFQNYPRLVVQYEDAAIGREHRGTGVRRRDTMADRPAEARRPAAAAAPEGATGAARPAGPVTSQRPGD